MEIVHLGKYDLPRKGGVETALRGLAELGDELGHQVECVVARVPSGQSPSPETETEPEIEPTFRMTRYPAWPNILSTPFTWSTFTHPFSSADVVHVHLPNPIAELAALLRRKGTLVPFLHSYPVNHGLLGALWFRLITTRVLKRAAMVLISNKNVLSGMPISDDVRRKIRVQPLFTKTLSKDSYQRIRPLRRDSKQVLALGRLVPYKGYDVLLRAWKKAMDQHPELRSHELHIIGDGPARASLKQLTKDLRLETSVSLHGSCSENEKIARLESAMLFVAPSRNRSETFGISILEAMAAGLPVITTDLDTGVAHLARGGRCGAVVPVDDVDALAQALVKTLSLTPQEKETIGLANLEFAASEHSHLRSLECYRTMLDLLETKS